MRQSYLQMKDVNEHYLKQLESGQQELDRLSMKKTELEEVKLYIYIYIYYIVYKYIYSLILGSRFFHCMVSYN